MTSPSPKKRSVEKWRFLANLKPRQAGLSGPPRHAAFAVFADDAARGRIAKY